MPMNAASVGVEPYPIMPPVLAAMASRAPSTWRRPARCRSWAVELDHLGDAGGAQRVAAGHEPAARVDGDPAAPDRGVPGQGGRPGVARLEEAEGLEGEELLGARGVVELDDVDVGRVDPGVVPGGSGCLGQPLVVVDVAVARPRRARPGSTAPAAPRPASWTGRRLRAPSVNDEHIGRVRGGTIGGQASTSSSGQLRLELGVGVEGTVPSRLDGGRRELLEGGVPFGQQGVRPIRRSGP